MKGLIFTISLFFTLRHTGLAADPTTPLYRYWHASASDHFYTIDPEEIGTTIPGGTGKYGYTFEGIECLIYRYDVRNSVPLYRYWNSSVSDHFYTINPNEIGTTTPGQTGKYGYVSEGIAGFCIEGQYDNSIPLYHYWKADTLDHFYTTSIFEIGTQTVEEVGTYGYKYEGIACYVLQA